MLVHLIFLLIFTNLFAQDELSVDLIEEGRYLAQAGSCFDCHRKGFVGPMSGGLALETPFGVFYTPNITPDIETGIGLWTLEDFRRALREGKSPDGEVYYPTFPYRSFSKMSDRDIEKLYHFLMSEPPSRLSNIPHQIAFPYNQRWLNYFWQTIFFNRISINEPIQRIRVGMGPFVADVQQSQIWNRGAYMVEAVIHCAECHTPRNRLGAPIENLWMSGSSEPINGLVAPNITPSQSGTGGWTTSDWKQFLETGFKPDGKSVGGDMAYVIQNTSALTASDREAIINYIMALPPIRTEMK